MNIERLEGFDVYNVLVEFRVRVFELIIQFPKEENYRLTDQLIRSSRSCPANLSEGIGRYYYTETLKYCRITRRSLFESYDHLRCAREANYIYIGRAIQRIEKTYN